MSNIIFLNNGHLAIEGAKLKFRNFEGRQEQYNNLGDRNFAVTVDDPEMVQRLIDEGWNIKSWTPQDDPDAIIYYIKVKVSYRFTPPVIDLIGSRNTQSLNEDTAGIADRANFSNVDLEISPSHWNMADGRSGITAYLSAMYATITEDYFGATKYNNGPQDEEAPFN